MLVVTWRREYVGGHFQEGICWWSLGGGSWWSLGGGNMLMVTWRREYVGGPPGRGGEYAGTVVEY